MKKMHFFAIIYLFSCCFVLFSKQNFVNRDTIHVKLIKQKKMEFCYISFVRIDGHVFLVKQKRILGHLVGVVHDALAAHIAQELDDTIAHKVMIIPAFKKFPGKIYDDWPATVHTLAPGATINGKRSSYKKMNIKQAAQGFRREMIPWMAKHRQLVKILALDIFLCNHDRHRGNLFYNAKTDSFCAIDMDCLFKHNLAACAYQNLFRMAEYDLFPLKVQEFFALLELRTILEYLVNKYQAEDITLLFDEFVQEAGLVEGSPLYVPRIQEEIDLSRRMIKQNYRDTHELIRVLGVILCRAIEQQPVLRNFQAVVDFEKKFNS